MVCRPRKLLLPNGTPMREYVIHILVGLLIGLLPGCSRQPKKYQAADPQSAAFSLHEAKTHIDSAASQEPVPGPISEIEAQLLDIPSMIGSMLIESRIQEDNQITLAWACPYELKPITSFYLQEMERSGWQKIAAVDGTESTLLFQKPKKICCISVRSLVGNRSFSTVIYLVVSPKN